MLRCNGSIVLPCPYDLHRLLSAAPRKQWYRSLIQKLFLSSSLVVVLVLGPPGSTNFCYPSVFRSHSSNSRNLNCIDIGNASTGQLGGHFKKIERIQLFRVNLHSLFSIQSKPDTEKGDCITQRQQRERAPCADP